MALRIAAIGLAVATIGAVGSAGASALQGRQVTATHTVLPSPPSQEPASQSDGTPETEAEVQEETPFQASIPGHDDPTADDAPAALAAAESRDEAPERGALMGAPIVDEGRTDLGDGLFAVRDGASVTVHFDVPAARTRRRDKFDRIVRETLPRVYGPVAQALLDRIPQGEIVSPGTLPSTLQESGLRLALANGSALALWPEIRDANGGPLVIGYRAEVAR